MYQVLNVIHMSSDSLDNSIRASQFRAELWEENKITNLKVWELVLFKFPPLLCSKSRGIPSDFLMHLQECIS